MTSRSAIDLYLDLIKSTLNFALWPEPPVPIEAFMYRKSAYKRLLIAVSSRLLDLKNLQLFEKRNLRADARDEGRFWPGLAHTMIGRKRLDNLQYCVETALEDQVEGDMIETGVWRGGACILMRAILAAHEVEDRRVFVADSFEGLPEPDEAKYPVDRGDTHHVHTFLAISQSEVENNFRSYGLLDEQVVFLKGWFEDTLPKAPIDKLAVLRLDGDMYGSTMVALTSLYPKLSRGGFCIIDDYGLLTCQKATDDFRAANGIRDELIAIDHTAKYWRKS